MRIRPFIDQLTTQVAATLTICTQRFPADRYKAARTFCCCPSNLIWPRVFSLPSAPRLLTRSTSSVTWRELKECGAVPDWEGRPCLARRPLAGATAVRFLYGNVVMFYTSIFCFLFPNSKPLHDPIDATLCQLFSLVAGAGAGDLMKWRRVCYPLSLNRDRMKRTQLDRDCDYFFVVEIISLVICLGMKWPILARVYSSRQQRGRHITCTLYRTQSNNTIQKRVGAADLLLPGTFRRFHSVPL